MRLKYMGSADVMRLNKGDDFGGRLSEGLSKEVVFDKSNNWVVDTDEAGLSEDAVTVLTDEDGNFKDVTDSSRVPSNLHQQMFMGHKKSVAADEVLTTSSSATDDAGGTTTGGSTGGTTGSTRSGGTKGGSTRGAS